jgi:hypothetical protein
LGGGIQDAAEEEKASGKRFHEQIRNQYLTDAYGILPNAQVTVGFTPRTLSANIGFDGRRA